MASVKREMVEGIKTFFVVPELTTMTEEYLLAFFQRGYETYILNDDPYLSLRHKIDALMALFPELILFFNIDRKLAGHAWPEFISALQTAYGQRAKIGVLYRKQSNPELARQLEKLYLFDIGITCGCVPTEFQKTKNLSLLANVLTANQAAGRRKFLRAITESRCRLNLFHEGVRHEGEIRDISISHFSCSFEGKDPGIDINRPIEDIQLYLAGTICKVNAIACVKRVIGDDLVYVFIFKNRHWRDGLDPEMLAKVNGFIYTMYQETIGMMVKRAFEKARSYLI